MTDERVKRKVYPTRSKTRRDLPSQQSSLLDQHHDPESSPSNSARMEAGVRALKQKLRESSTSEELLKLRVEELERRLELREIEMKLDQMKALDTVKQEFSKKLEERHEELVAERKRADSWVCGITELNMREKQFFESRIKSLEEEVDTLRQELAGGRSSTVSHVSSLEIDYDARFGEQNNESVCKDDCNEPQGSENVYVSESRCIDISEQNVSRTNTCVVCGLPCLGTVCAIHSVGTGQAVRADPGAIGGRVVASAGGKDTYTDVGEGSRRLAVASAPTLTTSSALISLNTPIMTVKSDSVSVNAPARVAGVSLDPQPSVMTGPVPSQSKVGLEDSVPQAELSAPAETVSSDPLIASMSKLLKAQSDMLSAQAQAVAVQNLPPLKKFSGENTDSEEDGFDGWLEIFEERAKMACWSEEQRLYQVKMHLERTALQIFRVLPDDSKKTYSKLVDSLKKRFKPVDIEELKGIEFHQKMQASESIEKLGITLQTLGQKAFPGISGKDFDRLLKGRFFQALHTKWQRKLGAPKPGESFSDLYDRARTIERHEKQFSEIAAAGRERKSVPSTSVGSDKLAQPPCTTVNTETSSKEAFKDKATSSHVATRSKSRVECRVCHNLGHYGRDCPSSGGSKSESPGLSSRSAALESAPVVSVGVLSQFSLKQLEQHLTQRKLGSETAQLESVTSESSRNSAISSDSPTGEVIGPTPTLNISVEGVLVDSLIDSGSQSTIISRAMLHRVAKKLKSEGRPSPKLTLPTVKVFGKDGKLDKRELNITAQTVLTFVADGINAEITVLVQPESEQDCLVGMNAIPKLGIQLLRSNGKPICVGSGSSDESSVRLVQACTIPGRRGRFLDGTIDGCSEEGIQILFQPNNPALKKLGLSSGDSLLTTGPDGRLLIPIQNHQNGGVTLEESLIVGIAEAVDASKAQSLNATDDCETTMEAVSIVNAVTAKDQEHEERLRERKEQLKKMLNIGADNSEQRKQLEHFLLSSDDVFSLNDNDLGRTSLVLHKVDTGDHPPTKQPPRRLPFSRREVVSQLVNDMTEKGIIQPSTSAWASPIVLVPKRDNTLRFCVDYRKVNAITKKDVYPSPRIDDILDTLGKSRYFSTLDLASGFWQIEMDPATRDKSAFTTHCGLHEFIRMPFGMCNAPATFQRLMQVVLAGIEWKFCFAYLDDILVSSKTLEEHIQHLQIVFERLRKAGLTLKAKKCFFAQDRVTYLGHEISREGVSPDPEKTRKVRDFPVPSEPTQVRQFLGLASYYRRFVSGFAVIANPLHSLLKKDTDFNWTEECQKSFDTLKQRLVTAPVLVYPRFGAREEFVLETDASLFGLGAVLGQKQADGHVHPIAYASRSLNVHEKNYSITELETLGLVWAVRYFRAYLLGHHTTVWTDHSACTSLLNASKPSAKLARWAMIVQEFDLSIKHRSGKSNSNADALSRNPLPDEEMSTSSSLVVQTLDSAIESEQSELKAEQSRDPELAALILFVRDGTVPEDRVLAKRLAVEGSQYDLINGVLCHENPNHPGEWRTVVPLDQRNKLLKEMHGGKFSGHFAWRKTYYTLRKRFWWRGMCGDTERFCKSCLECVSRKGAGRRVKPPLMTIPVGAPFHRVGVDVLQLPVTESGNKYVVVFIDYLTKWVEAFAVPDQSAVTIARLLVEEVFCRHGAPEQLLSDRGANFLSELVLEVCKQLQIEKVNTSGYHPQTNGMVEKFNSTLIGMVSKVAESSGRDWDRHLPFLLFAYRSAIHDSTGESPFYLVYGRDPRLPSENVLCQSVSPYVVDVDDYRHELTDCLSTAWSLAKEHIKGAQDRQKQSYDKNAKDHLFKVGDRVMIFMPSTVTGKAWKLARPYHGPYRVLSVTPTNIEARLVDDAGADSIFVAVNRVRPCATGLPNVPWTGPTKKRGRKKRVEKQSKEVPSRRSGPVTRSMTHNSP